MIQERQRLILRELVEAYIESGEPVGSKRVASRLAKKLSSATVRAVLSALAKAGYVTQPHTSAGRVPTDLGYRVYLDEMLVPSRLTLTTTRQVAHLEWVEGLSVTDLLHNAAETLSAPMGLAGLVAAPRLESAVIMRLELVWLGLGRVLAIAVTRGGLIHERLLMVDADLDPHQLEAFNNYLNEVLPGRSLNEVRRVIEAEARAARAAHRELEERALDLGRRALEDVGGKLELVVDGTARVLEKKEFSQEPAQAAALVRSLEERQLWLSLLERVTQAEDIEVYVGSETGTPALATCSLVTARYRSGEGVGLVALVGPRRMDYRRAVPLVGLVASRLSAVLRARVEH